MSANYHANYSVRKDGMIETLFAQVRVYGPISNDPAGTNQLRRMLAIAEDVLIEDLKVLCWARLH